MQAKELLLRDARCDELVFHVQHVTPHEKLRDYLKGSEEYKNVRTFTVFGDCRVYDPSGENHVNMVDRVYIEETGRNVRCDELQNHGLWQTSEERLRSFLEPNPYTFSIWIVGIKDEAKVSLYQNGIYQGSMMTYGRIDFKGFEALQIYRIKIENQGKVINKKVMPRPEKENLYGIEFDKLTK